MLFRSDIGPGRVGRQLAVGKAAGYFLALPFRAEASQIDGNKVFRATVYGIAVGRVRAPRAQQLGFVIAGKQPPGTAAGVIPDPVGGKVGFEKVLRLDLVPRPHAPGGGAGGKQSGRASGGERGEMSGVGVASKKKNRAERDTKTK